MDRSLILFWGGMMLVIALFVPLTLLQDSGQSLVASKEKKGDKRKWSLMEEPQEVKVRFNCLQKGRRGHGDLSRCQVLCPTAVQLNAARAQRALLRCDSGTWSTLREKKARTLVRRSVPLVEQQSVSPELLNRLLNHYLNRSSNFLAMAYFFDRADVQLPGFHHYFLRLWQESLHHARSVMEYINKRGGWIDMQGLPSPTLTDTLNQGQAAGYVGLVAMEAAVAMETESQKLIQELAESVQNSKDPSDPHLLHVLEERYLDQHVRQVKELMGHVTQLRAWKQAGQEDYRLGEYDLDSLLK